MNRIPRANFRGKNRNQFKRFKRLHAGNEAGTLNDRQQNRFNRISNKMQPRLERKIGRMSAAVDAGNVPDANRDKYIKRINRYQGFAGMDPTDFNTPPGGNPEENTTPGPGESAGGPYNEMQPTQPVDPNQQAETMTALMPETFVSNPADYQKSPWYDYQQERGSKALDRYHAARGLTKSGAEAQANIDFNQQLGAEDVQRQKNWIHSQQQLAQGNANRYSNMLQFDANMARNTEQDQFNNMMSLTNTMLGQSPSGYGYGAANSMANNQGQFGRDISGLTQSGYPGMPPANAYFTPHMSAPPFVPPMPSGPDYSGANAIEAGSGAANFSGFWNPIFNAFGSFAGQQ